MYSVLECCIQCKTLFQITSGLASDYCRIPGKRPSALYHNSRFSALIMCKIEVSGACCSACAWYIWHTRWFEYMHAFLCRFKSISGLFVQRSTRKEKYYVQESCHIDGRCHVALGAACLRLPGSGRLPGILLFRS